MVKYLDKVERKILSYPANIETTVRDVKSNASKMG